MSLTRIIGVNSPFEGAADRAPRLLQIELGDQCVIKPGFTDLVEDGRVLVPEVVGAKGVLEGPLATGGLRVRKNIELDRRRESHRTLLIEVSRRCPRRTLT